jgi:GH15 family glucan-1,4-alpha-glucosidase
VNGSIDFLCYPNFDSPTVFAALLDDQNGGRFEIRPQLTNARVRQMYLPETNILVTRFLAEEGMAELTDYMPIDNDGGEPNEIVRKVAVIRGDVRFQMCCKPRFSYAKCGHQLELSELCCIARAGYSKTLWSLFAIYSRFPKLDVAGSNPVSRSIFQSLRKPH